MKYISAFLMLVTLSTAAVADPLSLRAAKTPSSTPWDMPAQISYLNNSGSGSSYSINAAVSGNLPNIPNTTWQPQITAWVAKNTLLAKRQDKLGIEASIGFAGGDQHFGYIPQASLSIDQDHVVNSSESTIEITADLTSTDVNLGGCGKSIMHGCTYWDLLLGIYSNNVSSTENNTDLGRISGSKLIAKVTSNPYGSTDWLAPISLSLMAQGQWDASASGSRAKENRTLYKATVSWRFYKEGDSVKPSLSLERVVGADLLAGLDKQAYTQVSFRLAF